MLRNHCLVAFVFWLVLLVNVAGAKQWALLIGVEQYDTLRHLNYAVDDVEAVRTQLLQLGFPARQVILLHSEAASRSLKPERANIEREFTRLLSKVQKDDLIVIAFSGHGVHLNSVGGKPGGSYFCPSDADLTAPAKTMIRLDDVFDELSRSSAKRRLILVDACRNIPIPRETSIIKRPVPQSVGSYRELLSGFVKDLGNVPKDIGLISSCQAGEFSYEDHSFQRGAFTHFIVQGLGGAAADQDGSVLVSDLFKYVAEQTTAHVETAFGRQQTPTFTSKSISSWAIGRLPKGVSIVPTENVVFEQALATELREEHVITRDGFVEITDHSLVTFPWLPDFNGLRISIAVRSKANPFSSSGIPAHLSRDVFVSFASDISAAVLFNLASLFSRESGIDIDPQNPFHFQRRKRFDVTDVSVQVYVNQVGIEIETEWKPSLGVTPRLAAIFKEDHKSFRRWSSIVQPPPQVGLDGYLRRDLVQRQGDVSYISNVERIAFPWSPSNIPRELRLRTEIPNHLLISKDNPDGILSRDNLIVMHSGLVFVFRNLFLAEEVLTSRRLPQGDVVFNVRDIGAETSIPMPYIEAIASVDEQGVMLRGTRAGQLLPLIKLSWEEFSGQVSFDEGVR